MKSSHGTAADRALPLFYGRPVVRGGPEDTRAPHLAGHVPDVPGQQLVEFLFNGYRYGWYYHGNGDSAGGGHDAKQGGESGAAGAAGAGEENDEENAAGANGAGGGDGGSPAQGKRHCLRVYIFGPAGDVKPQDGAAGGAAGYSADMPMRVECVCASPPFALHAAAPGRAVLGVETSEQAVLSARRTAAEAGLADVEFAALDATAFAETAAEHPELVIVNPPRRGLGERLTTWLVASTVRTIVYSSCNVHSLERDLRALPGFVARRVRVFDMFPQTAHSEVMVLLERRGAGL